MVTCAARGPDPAAASCPRPQKGHVNDCPGAASGNGAAHPWHRRACMRDSLPLTIDSATLLHMSSRLVAVACSAFLAACVGTTPAPAADAAPPPTPIALPVPATSAANSTQAAPVPRPAPAAGDWRRVNKVIDGDTITVSGIGTVRLLGVDAPEKTGGFRESEAFGDQATTFMRTLVEGKLVRLEYDGDRFDQYKRTLAYVHLEDGTLANEEIIRAGLAETYRRFTYARKPAFQSAERDARAARRGMWARARRQ